VGAAAVGSGVATTLSERIVIVWSATRPATINMGWYSTCQWRIRQLIIGRESEVKVRKGTEMGRKDEGQNHLTPLLLRGIDTENENVMDGGGQDRGRAIEADGKEQEEITCQLVFVFYFSDLCTNTGSVL